MRLRLSRAPLALAAPLAPLVLLGACADDAPTGATPALARTAAASTASLVSTVMRNLNSPKGLALSPEGALYVAETGTGAINGPCIPGGEGEACYSATGSVSRLSGGVQQRIVTGLPSLASTTGGAPAGPHDVGAPGRGVLYVSIGLGAPPSLRANLGPRGTTLGTLVRVEPTGRWQVTADVTAFEATNNPDGRPPDSNPYGLLVEPGRQFLTDAGGNTVVEVRAKHTVVLAATLPVTAVPPGPFNPPFADYETVPTSVTRGPDGALYVGGLTGAPFLPGAAVIYRVVAGQAPQVYAGDFTTITDHAWGPDGSLYVLQFSSAPFFNGPGSVVRVAPNGVRTVLINTLAQPTGVAVGPDGSVYVTNKGTSVGGGEVLRVRP